MRRKVVDTMIDERRAEVARLFLQGVPQYEIAKRLLASKSRSCNSANVTICEDLKVIRANWKNSALRDFDEAKSRQLAKLELLEKESWEDFELSRYGQLDADVKELIADLINILPKGQKDLLVALRKLHGLTLREVGDPRVAAQILHCIAEQNELLGLKARPGELPTSPLVTGFRIHLPPANGESVSKQEAS